MNTPTDFLEGIHSSLEKLPEDIAALVNFERPNLPEFVLPTSFDMGPADLEVPALSSPESEGVDYPDFESLSAGMPDYPSQTPWSVIEADYPSMDSPTMAESMGGDLPDLAGFSMTATSMPDASQAEYDVDQLMISHLEDISRGITNLGRGGGSAAGGYQRSTGPQQVRGRSVYVRDIEADETFSQSSPSTELGSTAGLRGAGGYGYGSRYDRVNSALKGGILRRQFEHESQ